MNIDWDECYLRKKKGGIPGKEYQYLYHRYLNSRRWLKKRDAIRLRAEGICERCYEREGTAVHHLTYQNLFNEPLEDLQLICDGCHQYESAKSDIDPRWGNAPPYEAINTDVVCVICGSTKDITGQARDDKNEWYCDRCAEQANSRETG
jgi:hypothetical protein